MLLVTRYLRYSVGLMELLLLNAALQSVSLSGYFKQGNYGF